MTALPTWTELQQIAVPEKIDARTLRRVLRGEKVRGVAGIRAREVLAKAGLLRVTEADASTNAGSTEAA